LTTHPFLAYSVSLRQDTPRPGADGNRL